METKQIAKEYELVQVNSKEFKIEKSVADKIGKKFIPIFNDMTELENELVEVISLPMEKETFVKAKALRNKYVKVRTKTAGIHKDEKAQYREVGLYIDAWKNAHGKVTKLIETKLSDIEKYEENLKAEAIATLHKNRSLILGKFLEDGATPPPLGEMTDEIWNGFLNGMELAYNKREEKIKVDAEREKQELIIKTENLD